MTGFLPTKLNLFVIKKDIKYSNDPEFTYRQVWEKNETPGQAASKGAV